MCKDKNSWPDFIAFDLFGHAYNGKYPPNAKRYGTCYDGYLSSNQSVFFYDFCVQQYGVAFYYKGCHYEATFADEGPILTNQTTKGIQGPFADAVQLLEQSLVNGEKLIDVIDQLEYVVLH